MIFFLWAAQSNLLFYNEWYLKPLRELKIETIVLRSIFACAVQNETVTWRPRDWWKRSRTKEALYENLFLRQQDLQLSPPRANQTCCTEVRKPQSISNACNEKHIFVCQWKDNQQLNKGVNGFLLQGCSETNNTNLYQPLWLQFWILKQGYLKTSKTLTQLLAVVLISEYVCAVLPAVFLCMLCEASIDLNTWYTVRLCDNCLLQYFLTVQETSNCNWEKS